ncbi:hypothetical protein ES703_86418 [subsurface metagenome]
MTLIATDLSTWPRRRNGEPIFRTSDDAISYARLAHKRPHAADQMRTYRTKALRPLRLRSDLPDLTLQRKLNCAVRGQFFRECYEEIERINKEDK